MLYTSGGRQNELSSQQFQEVLEQNEIMAAEIKQNEQAPTGVIRMMLNARVRLLRKLMCPDVRSDPADTFG